MENNRKTLGMFTILLLTASALLFLFLYRFDNKYTSRGSQPIGGMLFLTEEELRRIPFHYLIYDWEFYPGVLLTPEDFETGLNRYCRYVSIGQYGGMEMGRKDRDTHGSGTYRMLINLPERADSYSLEIPEIYSSYRLYVGKELFAEIGNPDPEQYEPEIQNRVVNFHGGGQVQLLVAVSDFTHFYSGMVYPIAFGRSPVIQGLRGARLLLREVLLTLSLLVAVVSGFLYLKSREVLNGLYVILALCLVGYTVYPLLTSFFTLSLQPWYSLQMLCYYMMMPLVMLIYQWIAEDRNPLIRRTAWLLVGFSILTAVISIFIGSAQYRVMELYSLWGMAVKWISAASLLGAAVFMLRKNTVSSLWLYGGACVYACSLVADRLFPLYEPVMGGWFPEIGGFILLLLLHSVLWRRLMDAYRFQLDFAEHSRQMDQLLMMQQEHYKRLTERIWETRRLRHDMRQHMRTLSTLAEKGDMGSIRTYLKEYAENTEELNVPLVFCENKTADAVLNYYYGIAARNQVPLEITGTLPETEEISNVDISTMLGNILENALEAQKYMEAGKRWIRLHLQMVNGKMTVLAENPYNGLLKEKEGRFYSTKHEGLGVGTESIRRIAEKYGGYADFSYTECEFKTMAFLPVTAVGPKTDR